MRTITIILGTLVLIVAASAGWQIGAAEIANMNLQEDIRDIASQAGTHLGVVVPKSDDDVSRAVILKAKEHGINLSPGQVTVRRMNPGEASTFYVTADYTVPVNVGFYSFPLHFTPSSDKAGI
jgi:hypothetical protein